MTGGTWISLATIVVGLVAMGLSLDALRRSTRVLRQTRKSKEAAQRGRGQ